MEDEMPSEGSIPSVSSSFNLKRTISSEDDSHLTRPSGSQRKESLDLDNGFSDPDMNDSKRRRLHDQDSRSYSNNGSTVTYSSSSRTLRTTATVSAPTPDSHPEPPVRTVELRRTVKRVNYAVDIEESGEDEEERDQRRTRPRAVQRRSTTTHEITDDDEPQSDHHEEPKIETFGTRTLRDRSSITAPKPFPVSNPEPRRQRRQHSHQNGSRRYGDSDNAFRSSSRSLPPKRAPPPPRQLVEGMRITRGMSGSLVPDSPSSRNSRDMTPDQPNHRSQRQSSRFHHIISSDEEGEDHQARGDEGEEGEEENGEDEQDSGMNAADQDDTSLIRATRLRARKGQPALTNNTNGNRNGSRGRPERASGSKSNAQQDSDRKYDLRERPKNRPTYIADRPIPSPTRPRTTRLNLYGGGRDPFASRPRQGRSNIFDALGRAGGSSADEHDVPSYKRRSGNSDNRSASTSRILPMNMSELAESRRDVIAMRAGQPADTDPLAVSNTVDFDKVGGLDHHIKSLKEMVILPLLYPEVYSHFQVMPPRGVLFHGPPGTGKTLLARALASSCSTETQKVAFFMRKGADCLSKWVGEAERQLRLLFEEAKAWQPSIIFFDEIDGLCPVRSSKQEQIHASIVSTMLALMDGLDGRGQVIVIGATNRIDAIDPALRRPGRFDREFYFPLPNEAARRSIIDINTNGWVPALEEGFKDELARMTTRYCGADIKALCTEAALKAIRRRYPQIYESNEKLLIDASSIVVEEIDMLKSAKALTPASYRVTGATASPLPPTMKALLQGQLSKICRAVDTLFARNGKESSKNVDEDDDVSFQAMGYRSFSKLKTFRPRMIITGDRGMGQRYIGPALLHYLEGCTVQQFDLAALLSESSRTPEAACVQFFIEVKRHAPSVIYIPHIDVWWKVVSDAVKATFSNLLEDLNPEDGILFLATSEARLSELPITIRRWFLSSAKGRIELSGPEASLRSQFFEPLIHDLAKRPTDFKILSTEPVQLESLKKAPPPQPRVPTAEEKKLLREHDEYILRELRISLRTVVDELFKDRTYKPFFRPVEQEEFEDYYEVIKKPMDLTKISDKINSGVYVEVKEFLADVDLIVENAMRYNDPRDPSRIINKARSFQDFVHAMTGRFDPELISETAKTAARCRQENKVHHRVQGERMSRRKLGLEAPTVPDDPEMYIRNKSILSRLHLESSREASMDVEKRGDTMENPFLDKADKSDAEANAPEEVGEEVELKLEIGARDDSSLAVDGSGVGQEYGPHGGLGEGTGASHQELERRLFGVLGGTMDVDAPLAGLKNGSSLPALASPSSSSSLSTATTTGTNTATNTPTLLSAAAATAVLLSSATTTTATTVTTAIKHENADIGSALPVQRSRPMLHPKVVIIQGRRGMGSEVGEDVEMTAGTEDSDEVASSSLAGAAADSLSLESNGVTNALAEDLAATLLRDSTPTTKNDHEGMEIINNGTTSLPAEEQSGEMEGSDEGATGPLSQPTQEEMEAEVETEIEVVPEPEPEFELDQDRVQRFGQQLVTETEGSTVEELDQLRASLYGDIWEHRLEWNKDLMLDDMTETLLSVTGMHREYRALEAKEVERFMEGYP